MPGKIDKADDLCSFTTNLVPCDLFALGYCGSSIRGIEIGCCMSRRHHWFTFWREAEDLPIESPGQCANYAEDQMDEPTSSPTELVRPVSTSCLWRKSATRVYVTQSRSTPGRETSILHAQTHLSSSIVQTSSRQNPRQRALARIDIPNHRTPNLDNLLRSTRFNPDHPSSEWSLPGCTTLLLISPRVQLGQLCLKRVCRRS